MRSTLETHSTSIFHHQGWKDIGLLLPQGTPQPQLSTKKQRRLGQLYFWAAGPVIPLAGLIAQLVSVQG